MMNAGINELLFIPETTVNYVTTIVSTANAMQAFSALWEVVPGRLALCGRHFEWRKSFGLLQTYI